ncbi:TITIN-like protein [Mya arenaria]|uniref:TITIN-like protein n=1 Tax=Mya arenaria TaxID=6604 RepID=A0ABY7FT45_MYAAR|nr:TITIN-like protein [Mya arenaria]
MCSTDDNDIAHCVCLRDGYVVEDVNSQCEAERYRFDVRMPLEAGPAIIFSEMDATIDNVKQTNHFPESGVTYPFKLKVHGIRGMTEPVLKFTLYFWTSEVEVVRKAVERFRIQANISNIRFLDVPAVLDINPELQLMEVVNTEKYPTLRGKMLTLVCAAKGSKDTQFEWYKDGVRLNTSLTSRVAWETVISHTAHEKRISNLHLDVVMPIDQGIFTCKVRDFDEVASKSLEVTVNNYPQVQIDPMSMSVQSGRPITIKCMSLDDSWQQFLYEWYKNGLTIDPSSRSEYTEDMYPTGVQLVVSRITMTTEYTCKVTNEAGSANVSSYVFVVSGEYLLASYRLGVVDVGNARRDCTCDMSSHICKWATPNFSKCQSLMLIKIFDDLVLLRSGYQETTLSAIFNDLYSFALTKNKNATLYSGDIDMVAGILKELITHMNAFPILCENDDRIKSKSVVDVLGAILRLSAKATIEEKQDIMVGPSVICSIHYLISGAVTLLEYKPTERIVNPDIAADRQIVYMVTARHLAELLVYRDMSATGIKRMKFESMSRVYSLAPLVNDNMDPETPTVRLTLFHDTKGRVTKYNTTRCFRWLFDPLNIYSGRWSQDGCVIIESRLNSTTCECKLPGHFVAGLIPSNYSEIQVAKPDREILPEFVVSYILSIIILLISFIAYFKTYGFLTRDLYLVNMGFFFAVLAIACLSFTCMLHLSASLVVMEIFSHTISFLTFVIWSAMLVEIIHICLIAYKSTNIQMTSCKFATFIFGIPAILTAFLILVAQLDKGRSCHVICWLYDGTRQFYVFVSIIVVYIIVYAVFYSLCLNKILRWKEESKFTERKMHLIAILKNAALLVSVCFAMGSAISLESNSHTAHRVIHTILIIFYSIMIFLVRCLLDKDDQMKNKAFRAYMKPEFVSHVVVSQEQYNVSKYYDEVNRTKYTVERKRELSALLGSSASSAAITADTNSTTVSYNSSSDGSKDSNAPSGLVDFTYPSRRDSRLDTISDSKSSLSDRSVGMSGNVKDEMFVARARSHITDDTISVQKDDKIGIHKASNSGDFKNSTAARVDILKKKSSVPVARSKAITRNSLQRQCSQSSVNHGKESQSMLPDSTTNHSVQRHELLPNTSRSESSNTTNTKEQISCNVAKFQKNNLKSPKQQTENTVGKSYDISTCQDEDQIEISCSSKLLQIS